MAKIILTGLFSIRIFFTSSFRPEFYARFGLDWVMNNGPAKNNGEGKPSGHEMEVSPLKRVLLRAIPSWRCKRLRSLGA